MQKRCKRGAKGVQSQCDFLTENERTIVDLLKEQPRQHTEIMKTCLKKGISKRTVNNLLKKLEGKMIFRVEAENGIFTITIDSKEFIINTKDEENNNYESGPEDFE